MSHSHSGSASRVSAINSSYQALAASGTFTGVAEETVGFSTLMISAKTDADGTLSVDFSPDGTNWDRTVSFTVQSGLSEIHRLVTVMRYYRVRFVNGTSAQSYMRLQVLMNDHQEPSTALNSTLVQPDSGSILTRSLILGSPFLNNIRSSILGSLSTADVQILAGKTFTGTTLDTSYYATTLANNGTVVQAGGACRVRTGSTADGAATLNSIKYARFISGRPNTFACTVAFDHTGTSNNVAEWGVGTAADRFVFRFSGGSLYAVVRSGGSDLYAIISTSWNGNRTLPTFTNVNQYEIHYNTNSAYFVINGVLMHTVQLIGQGGNTGGLTEELSLPLRFSNINSGGSTSDVSMYVSGPLVAGAGIPHMSGEIYKYITTATTTLTKIGTGQLHRIALNTAANGTIKLYDGLTAVNEFASIAVSSTDTPVTWEFDVQFNVGLTIVTSAAFNITAIFE